VLLDLGLPGIDGFQVAERIRAMPDGARTLLIAISATGRTSIAAARDRSASTSILVKPVDPVAITECWRARPAVRRPLGPGNVVAFQKTR
jgi:CheY-like chemotaxis protein